ncbi:MAG: hypothetical protein ACOCVZ_03425, partial [Gemmatimonadota bacterium]
GVPRAAEPAVRGPDREIVPQQNPPKPFHRAGLAGPTLVYGTAQPPRGASGVVRAAAYRVPEHFARHWMLLLMADRLDVVEDRAGNALSAPLEALGLKGAAAYARGNPLPLLGGAAAGILATIVLRRWP